MSARCEKASKAVGIGSESTLINHEIISRIYFPRMIIPISNVFVACVDFIIEFIILFALGIFLGKVSEGSTLKSGIVMVLAGILTSIIPILLSRR